MEIVNSTTYSKRQFWLRPVLWIAGILLLLWLASGCREPYNGPAGAKDIRYLVVDGTIDAGSDSTIIVLSRTRDVSDTAIPIPEYGASVAITGAGQTYTFYENPNGHYINYGLNLDPNQIYQLQITTSDGKKYISDTIHVKLTPDIDSISWIQDSTSVSSKKGVYIYANTHDPQNNTHYYRWTFTETWEHDAGYDSYLLWDGTTITYRTLEQHTYKCYSEQTEPGLLLGSSAKLSEDVIYRSQLKFIPLSDVRLSATYSMLVKQYALSEAAYQYFTNLKKNTELTGSVFDPMPSEVAGNMHCITDPGEPVLGYVGASTVKQMRIFISRQDVHEWAFNPAASCDTITTADYKKYFTGFGYVPVHYVDISRIFASTQTCTDCRLQGGTLNKPYWWPN